MPGSAHPAARAPGRTVRSPPMDLRFGEKEEALRLEVRGFLQEHLGQDGGGSTGIAAAAGMEDDFARAHEFNSKLAVRGWIAPAWPTQYGGLGASIYEQMVFSEEFGYYGAPDYRHPRLRSRHDRADAHHPRQRRTEGPLPAGHHQRRGRLVPGLLGARRGLRPRLPADPRRPRRRRLRDQRLQDLDLRRPPRQPDVHPGPHRPGCTEAQRHQLPHHRRP